MFGTDDLATPREVAESLRITTRCLRMWVAKRGFPPPIRLSRQTIRYRVSEVLDWLAAHDAPTKEPKR
jgi:predicted DNA-binding transcriptional regulator AlpA